MKGGGDLFVACHSHSPFETEHRFYSNIDTFKSSNWALIMVRCFCTKYYLVHKNFYLILSPSCFAACNHSYVSYCRIAIVFGVVLSVGSTTSTPISLRPHYCCGGVVHRKLRSYNTNVWVLLVCMCYLPGIMLPGAH